MAGIISMVGIISVAVHSRVKTKYRITVSIECFHSRDLVS